MSTLELKITEGQINNAIAVALAEAFTQERKDALIRDIIRQHLSIKKDSYSKETLFSQTVNQQLAEMVKEEMSKHIEAMRPEVEAAVAEIFPSIKSSIVDQLKRALADAAIKGLRLAVYTSGD